MIGATDRGEVEVKVTRQPDPAPSTGLSVCEIFRSIQGESTRAGMPCVFVRLAGCPMRCVWCDTTYAFAEGTPMSVEEVMTRTGRFGCRLVEVTGGEPLAQRGTLELLTRLVQERYTVLLETGGGVSIEGVDPHVTIVYDVKCPDSGEEQANRIENLDLLKSGIDEVKFVLASRADYEWALRLVRSRSLEQRHPILFSPAVPILDPIDLAQWILADDAPVRLQLQLHKILWGSEARGV